MQLPEMNEICRVNGNFAIKWFSIVINLRKIFTYITCFVMNRVVFNYLPALTGFCEWCASSMYCDIDLKCVALVFINEIFTFILKRFHIRGFYKHFSLRPFYMRRLSFGNIWQIRRVFFCGKWDRTPKILNLLPNCAFFET